MWRYDSDVRHIRRSLLLIACVAAATAALAAAPDPRDPLVGTWTGKSICTPLRPACHDEQALYRIRKDGDDEKSIVMSMAKVVDGREIVMGELAYHVDYEHSVLSAELNHGLWTFQWSGTHMTGTLKLPPKGEVARNIDLRKE